MKILLSQTEIAAIVQKALIDYASQVIVIPEGAEVQVAMTDDGAVIELGTLQPAAGSAKTGTRRNQAQRTAPVAVATTPVEDACTAISAAVSGEPAASNVKPFMPKPTSQPAPEPSETSNMGQTEPDPKEGSAAEGVGPEDPTANPPAEESPPPAPARSLFANLRKPSNAPNG